MCSASLGKNRVVSLLALVMAGVGLLLCCQMGQSRPARPTISHRFRPATAVSLQHCRERLLCPVVVLANASVTLPLPCVSSRITPLLPPGSAPVALAAAAVSRGPPLAA